MDILGWIQNNALAITLPILSGFLAWFFSRNREASEIKKTEAEQEKIMAERNQIAVDASNKAISIWVSMYNEMNKKYDSLYAELRDLEQVVSDTKKELALATADNHKLKRTVDFLLSMMDKYNPEISKTAKEMLEKGLD